MNWNDWILEKNIDATLEKLHISRQTYIEFLYKANELKEDPATRRLYDHADQIKINDINKDIAKYIDHFLPLLQPKQKQIFQKLLKAVAADPYTHFVDSRLNSGGKNHVLRLRHLSQIMKATVIKDWHKQLPKIVDPAVRKQIKHEYDNTMRDGNHNYVHDYAIDLSDDNSITLHHSPHGNKQQFDEVPASDPSSGDMYEVDGKRWISHTYGTDSFNSLTDNDIDKYNKLLPIRDYMAHKKNIQDRTAERAKKGKNIEGVEQNYFGKLPKEKYQQFLKIKATDTPGNEVGLSQEDRNFMNNYEKNYNPDRTRKNHQGDQLKFKIKSTKVV